MSKRSVLSSRFEIHAITLETASFTFVCEFNKISLIEGKIIFFHPRTGKVSAVK